MCIRDSYIETSAKTGQNLDELLPFLVNRVYWKVRVGNIKAEQGWLGVTKGEMANQRAGGESLIDLNNRSATNNINDKKRCCS